MTNLMAKPAGLYLHIPFCRQICRYCHFSRHVAPERRGFLKQLRAEIQHSPYAGHQIDTIYWGGGTPSLLTTAELARVLAVIKRTFAVIDPEITLEVNPEDLTIPKLRAWQKLGINRLSIGVQTLTDPVLKNMGRRYSGAQVTTRVRRAAAYFPNLNIDLIIGLPGETLATWQHTLTEIRTWPITHLSAYFLDPEGSRLTTAELPPEPLTLQMHQALRRQFRHWQWYEVSAWCQPGATCRHNRHYWQHDNYLGFGAGAHSFWQNERWAHDGDLATYAQQDPTHRPHLEQLTTEELDWELWLTGLRTRQGVDTRRLRHPQRYAAVEQALIQRHQLQRRGPWLSLRHWSRQVLFLDSLLAEIVQKA